MRRCRWRRARRFSTFAEQREDVAGRCAKQDGGIPMGCTETDCKSDCNGLRALDALEPDMQAQMLAHFARQARLVRTALSDDRRDADADAAAAGFQRALGQAMDADEDIETQAALRDLSATLRDARQAGLKLSARIEELQLDGVLGTQRLPVLTAVLSAA
jgi:hypothetical protein